MPLSNREITLVGCGAIGGYAARSLVQMGAGRDEGRLTIIDPDELDRRNIGRHVLGADSVGSKKVTALRELIETDFPGTRVSAIADGIERHRQRFNSSDLVIDATGEEGIGDLLNEWRLEDSGERPAVLHVWINGHGAAVQSLLCSDREFGCFRCQRVDLNAEQVYDPLKPDAPRDLTNGCGESNFTPYGPAAPLVACGLLTKHAVDWATGKERPYLRTAQIDYASTRIVKPSNPSKKKGCPACALPTPTAA